MTANSFGQEYIKSITSQFLDYNNLVIKKDFDKALDYSFDEFFQIIPKNQMVLLMKKTFENPDMEFQIEFPSLNDFEEIKVFKEKSYVKFNSYGVLKLKFKVEIVQKLKMKSV